MKVAEECCWAMIHGAWQSCCGRLGFSVVDSGFKLGSLTHAYTFDHMNTEFRPDPPERKLLRKAARVCILALL
jgi:hypothetical protein